MFERAVMAFFLRQTAQKPPFLIAKVSQKARIDDRAAGDGIQWIDGIAG